MTLKELIYSDLYRFNRRKGLLNLLNTALRKIEFRYVLFFRLYRGNKFLKLLFWFPLRHCSLKSGIQIGWKANIGSGLVIVHFGAIAINNDAVIGDNCNVTHGVTIGISHRGKNRGCPVIGNDVWIGANAVIVGNVNIGNDVLIAPLAYVNFDVPSHSIVIGNPGKIIPRQYATEGYIVNKLDNIY